MVRLVTSDISGTGFAMQNFRRMVNKFLFFFFNSHFFNLVLYVYIDGYKHTIGTFRLSREH